MLIKYPKLLHDDINTSRAWSCWCRSPSCTVAAVALLPLLVMSAVTTASVHIDGKILTITGNTGCEHLVLEAGEVLDKHFNVGSSDSNQAALPGPDTPSSALTAVAELKNSSQVGEVNSNDGCAVVELMETQMPGPFDICIGVPISHLLTVG